MEEEDNTVQKKAKSERKSQSKIGNRSNSLWDDFRTGETDDATFYKCVLHNVVLSKTTKHFQIYHTQEFLVRKLNKQKATLRRLILAKITLKSTKSKQKKDKEIQHCKNHIEAIQQQMKEYEQLQSKEGDTTEVVSKNDDDAEILNTEGVFKEDNKKIQDSVNPSSTQKETTHVEAKDPLAIHTEPDEHLESFSEIIEVNSEFQGSLHSHKDDKNNNFLENLEHLSLKTMQEYTIPEYVDMREQTLSSEEAGDRCFYYLSPAPEWIAQQLNVEEIIQKLSHLKFTLPKKSKKDDTPDRVHVTRQVLVPSKSNPTEIFMLNTCKKYVKSFHEYWNNIQNKSPYSDLDLKVQETFIERQRTHTADYLYDVAANLFKDTLEIWNLAKIQHPFISADHVNGNTRVLEGINSVFVYIGSFASRFGIHSEDFALFSISFMHFMAENGYKLWYGIVPRDLPKFLDLMNTTFLEKKKLCRAFLRHKDTFCAASFLRNKGIGVKQVFQAPNQFVITRTFHWGVNFNQNINSAINFSNISWLKDRLEEMRQNKIPYSCEYKCSFNNIKSSIPGETKFWDVQDYLKHVIAQNENDVTKADKLSRDVDLSCSMDILPVLANRKRKRNLMTGPVRPKQPNCD